MSMSSTSAADESSGGSSVTAMTTQGPEPDTSDTSSSGATQDPTTQSEGSSTGAQADCAAIVDPNFCFIEGCFFDLYGQEGCHPPYDDATCAEFVDVESCLNGYCTWSPENAACSANVVGDCHEQVEPSDCLYSQCLWWDSGGGCWEPGELACAEITGVKDCVLNLCYFDSLSVTCIPAPDRVDG